ncbi:MAG: hypothetical protein ACJ76W_12190 [Chloroflexota bacterium]
MSRNTVLAIAGFMWVVVAVDAIANLLIGEFFFPVVAAIGFVGWAALFRHHYAQAPARVAEAEA